MPVRSCTLAKSRPTACTYHEVMAVSNARTFMRLIVFLRPYRSSLILSTILAVLSQAGISVLTCREERSEIEEAFLSIAGGDSR